MHVRPKHKWFKGSLRTGVLSILVKTLLVVIVCLTVHNGKLEYKYKQCRIYFPFERSWSARRQTFVISQLPFKGRDASEAFKLLAEVVVHRYIRFHKKERFQRYTRKLIWTGFGNTYGFGDRFRGILHAYICAVLSERILIIKWTEPFPLNVLFESADDVYVMYDPKFDGPETKFEPKYSTCKKDKGNLKVLPVQCSLNTRHNFFPWCKCTLENLGVLLSNHKTVELRSEHPPTLRSLFGTLKENPKLTASRDLTLLVNQWRESSSAIGDDRLYSLIFRNILRPSQELLDLLAKQGPELRSLIPPRLLAVAPRVAGDMKREYIAVHARIGYGLNESNAYPLRFNLERRGGSFDIIASCLARRASALADEMDQPRPHRFFLACDTPQLAKLFRNRLRQYDRDAVILEVRSKKVHSNAMRVGSQEDRERFLYTAVDLFFLSTANVLLSLPSGFPNIAKWFGQVPHLTVTVSQCIREADGRLLHLGSFY